jgi:hypothetical protein
MDVHVGTTDYGNKGLIADDIAAAPDDPFASQIHDVTGHCGATDSELVRDITLGDQPVGLDECEDLLFSVSYHQTYVCFMNICL